MLKNIETFKELLSGDREEPSVNLDEFEKIGENIALQYLDGNDDKKSYSDFLIGYFQENHSPQVVQEVSSALQSQPVYDVVQAFKKKINASILVDSFLHRSLETQENMNNASHSGKGKIPPMEIIWPKNIPTGKLENYAWIMENPFFRKNAWMNWGRLAGVLPAISYDTIYGKKIYNFTTNEKASNFSDYVNSINGSYDAKVLKGDVVTLGGGTARDEISFLEKNKDIESITIIENSPHAVNIMREKVSQLRGDYQQKIKIEPNDMQSVLEKMKEEKKQVDAFYSLSSLHYFDTPELEKILHLIKDCLSPNGHFAFAVKAPDTTFDGVGVSLIKNEEILSPQVGNEDEGAVHRIYKRASLGVDGQVRFYRDITKWKRILEKAGFNVVRITTTGGIENNYEFKNQEDQNFYQIIVRKASK
ncbi:class I SAM-dependent methyltransferase [Candidatus Gracilibacteria bacterium]|nr:class I SAM-dependent methyltransferase [Candidatus Gracilibacteria bacterium]